MPASPFSLGLDYRTNLVRALIVRCADGADFGSATVSRRSAPRPPTPGDYLRGVNRTADLSRSMKELLALQQGARR